MRKLGLWPHYSFSGNNFLRILSIGPLQCRGREDGGGDRMKEGGMLRRKGRRYNGGGKDGGGGGHLIIQSSDNPLVSSRLLSSGYILFIHLCNQA